MRLPFAALAASVGALSLVAGLRAQNPVATALQSAAARQARNLVEAAAEMPADKYGYKPTPAQMTFGRVVTHLAGGNYAMCSSIAGTPAPEPAKVTPEDPKDKLVAALKSSFDFCTSALAHVDDSKLADSVPFFEGRKMTRGGLMMALAEDWADHYSQAAIYLRLNGLLPPTAKRGAM